MIDHPNTFAVARGGKKFFRYRELHLVINNEDEMSGGVILSCVERPLTAFVGPVRDMEHLAAVWYRDCEILNNN